MSAAPPDAAAPLELASPARPRARGRAWTARLGAGVAALAGPRVLPWLLAAVVFAVFLPTLQNEFVEWDDKTNLTENRLYRGLGWPQIRWMFTGTLMGHYIPVTWLTFGLDYTLWGLDPVGYHLTNNVLHAANAALFYLVALCLIGRAMGLAGAPLRLAAAMATLFFALHPLRVESVAWATERRDVLSGMFFLSTVLLYLRAADGGSRRRPLLAAATSCFALGMLSKSIVMTLPLSLVILDIYPLGRLSWLPWRWTAPAARAALREKLPFLAVSVAGAAVSYWAVAHQDYVTSLNEYPWTARVGMTFYSYWFYVWKTAWPSGLSALYELPLSVNPLAPRFLGSAVGVVAISAGSVALAAFAGLPAALAAWLHYLVFLGPVTGIVHSGHQLTHDRYSYLSCLGFALVFGGVVGAVAADRLGRLVRPNLVRLSAAMAAVWILAVGTLTWYQIQVWRDTESLWRYAIESEPDCSICYSNLGSYVMKVHAAYPEARAHFEQSLALRPDRHRTRSNYGLTLVQLGEVDRGLEQLHLAVAWNPWLADALANLGGALIRKERYAEAIGYFERGLSVNPDHAILLANMGSALTASGRAREAIPYLDRALERSPEDPLIHMLRGRALLAAGEFQRASDAFLQMGRLNSPAARRLAGGLVWL